MKDISKMRTIYVYKKRTIDCNVKCLCTVNILGVMWELHIRKQWISQIQLMVIMSRKLGVKPTEHSEITFRFGIFGCCWYHDESFFDITWEPQTVSAPCALLCTFELCALFCLLYKSAYHVMLFDPAHHSVVWGVRPMSFDAWSGLWSVH